MKNKKMSFLAVLVMLVAVTAYSVSGTYAKYTSTFEGSDTARVAKWAFTLNGADADMVDNEFDFDLFKTINDTNGSAETDINPADGTIIAPGTQGSFTIALQNKSEVTAEYYVVLTETANAGNIPVEYSLDGTTWLSLADMNNALKTAKNLEMNPSSDTETEIHWRWAFEATKEVTVPGEGGAGDTTEEVVDDARDDADTALGTAGTATITVKAEVVVTQVD